ncbi:MAG: TonB-dependent receptor [Alphaproteobacteria bacterium]|nr:TonB-dependent receptor [Alphaproteobacteria bacterium]
MVATLIKNLHIFLKITWTLISSLAFMNCNLFRSTSILCASLLIALPHFSYADEGLGNLERLKALKNTKVTSVSKQPEDPFEAAAAIYVITREDIKRSGATSIPEILRGVPGLDVAQIGSDRWAVSSRGFNDQLTNKLLVLIDGRSVYTPVYSGVNWDSQDVPIDDIKQIEVIRGPGAALWGANAVNGIINIITEEANNTIGKTASVIVGNNEEVGNARIGGKISDNAFYRTYVKYSNHEESHALAGGQNHDGWDNAQTGFRIDWDKTSHDNVTFQGDIYKENVDRIAILPTLAPPFAQSVTDDNPVYGGNLLGRWNHTNSNGSNSILQTYIDHFSRDFDVSREHVTTFDLDFQNTLASMGIHEITWGVGYRLTAHNEPDRFYFEFLPHQRSDNLFSSFIQDKMTLRPDEVFLTLGSKFEHNDYTGIEIQPSARLAWLPTKNQTVWGAVSRSVRTPSRAEHDITQILATIPFSGFVEQVGRDGFDSEDLIAYELGYRIRPKESLTIDATAFYNDYNHLRTFEIAGPASGDIALPLTIYNNGYGESYGFELTTSWQVSSIWELSGSYSFIEIDTHLRNNSGDTELVKEDGKAPQNQFNIRSHFDLPHRIEVDNTLYYTDDLTAINIPSYFRFDTRIAWKPTEAVELDLVGQNLFDSYHPEFSSIPSLPASEVRRNIFGKVKVSF